jgi:beta-exotoxin I transport system permease protein
MNRTLFFKLLRDVRWSLLLVGLLLFVFQLLWSKITDRVTGELLPAFAAANVSAEFIKNILFKGPAKLVLNLIGGEGIGIDKVRDLLSIAYVHPLTQTIFTVWAIGRSAAALAGETDRGTMELLLAQPIPRKQIILTHLAVDLVTIPVLCLFVLAGTLLGTTAFGLREQADISRFPPALANAAALMFAISGYTLAISAAGRFRWRVVSIALGATLVQFLLNLLGQLWDVLEPFRPLTVFYYYQPQAIILDQRWTVAIGKGLPGLAEGDYLFRINAIGVLLAVGAVGYVVAWITFRRRDLPAPL